MVVSGDIYAWTRPWTCTAPALGAGVVVVIGGAVVVAITPWQPLPGLVPAPVPSVFSVGQTTHGLFHLLFHLLPCWVSHNVPHCPSQVLPSKGLQHVGTCWDMLGQIR